jgi:hypothetical protein
MQPFESSYGHPSVLSGRAAQCFSGCRMAACAAFVFLLVVPCLALATPDYPVAVDVIITTSCPNPNSRCLMCHTTARGGQGTAAQPFALELRDYGLNRGRDAALLQAALTALPDDQDSDRDGEPDKEELFRCGNPSGEDLGIGPEYGCDGARLAPRAEADGRLSFGTAVLAIGALALARRARRTP